ncbi:hypothetical protein ABPG74_016164 [Tetrahymena malaccensis]
MVFTNKIANNKRKIIKAETYFYIDINQLSYESLYQPISDSQPQLNQKFLLSSQQNLLAINVNKLSYLFIIDQSINPLIYPPPIQLNHYFIFKYIQNQIR